MKISVQVKPGSKQNQVEEGSAGLVVKLKAPPVDGKANSALICVLAEHFGVRKSDVEILHGQAGRRKLVEIRKDP